MITLKQLQQICSPSNEEVSSFKGSLQTTPRRREKMLKDFKRKGIKHSVEGNWVTIHHSPRSKEAVIARRIHHKYTHN